MIMLPKWRTLGVGLLGLMVTGWSGEALAAKWANPDLLVTPEIVKQNLGKADWVVVDCRDLKDYAKGHIPGAISFGKRCKKALRDATSRVFRDTSKYEAFLGKVGIGNDTNVVFYYDGLGTLTDATVAFWLLEYLGHDKAHVLNGGLDAWRKAGNRLDAKPARRKPATFKANIAHNRYAETDEVLKIATGKGGERQLLDSRTANEHKGKDMRALRAGYVPNTNLNVSHIDTLARIKDPKTGKVGPSPYFDANVAAAKFKSLDRNKRTIAYCQTGTRSTMTYFQMRLLGFKDPANWDDSWRVYGSEIDYPVADEQWYNFAGVNKKIKSLEKKIKSLEAAAKK